MDYRRLNGRKQWIFFCMIFGAWCGVVLCRRDCFGKYKFCGTELILEKGQIG